MRQVPVPAQTPVLPTSQKKIPDKLSRVLE